MKRWIKEVFDENVADMAKHLNFKYLGDIEDDVREIVGEQMDYDEWLDMDDKYHYISDIVNDRLQDVELEDEDVEEVQEIIMMFTNDIISLIIKGMS